MEINIDGDPRGAVDASKRADTAMGNLGSTLKKMALAGGALFLAKKAFDALGAAMGKVIDFTKESIKLAGVQEAAEKKLATALETAGIHTEGAAKRLNEYAAELQKVTTYGDETIIGVESMLATFGASEDVIKDATMAVLDMASAMDMDLNAAAILVGKAIAGETGTLSRYGIIIDQDKYAAEGFSVVLDALNDKFSGQAQSAAETYAGKLEQMKNVFGDIKEDVGFALIPTLTNLMEWFVKGKEVVDPFTGAVTNLESPLERIKTWVGEAADNMGRWLDLNWDNIVSLASETFTKIEAFIRIIKEADYSAINKGLQEMGTAFGIVIGDSSSGVTGADVKYQEFINNIGEGMETLATAMAVTKGIADSIYFIVGIITNSISIAIEFLGALGTWFISAGREGEEQFNALDFTISAFKDMTVENYNELKSTWDTVTTFMERETVSSTGNVEKEFNEMAGSIAANFGNLDSDINTFQERINALQGTNITSTHTIISRHEDFFVTNSGYISTGRASGGSVGYPQYAPDLKVGFLGGETILPAAVTRAIKQNLPSFAGLDMSGGGIVNNFSIGEMVVREEADVGRIATELYNMQNTRARLAWV